MSSSRTCTSEEAARLLGVCARRVRQLKDYLGYRKHGRTLVFDRAAVRRYARENGYSPAPEPVPDEPGEAEATL